MSGWPGPRATHGGVDEIVTQLPGRLLLCGKHYIAPDPDQRMAEVGADVVVCLCEEHEFADRYPLYRQWLLDNRPGRAAWFPIHDLSAPEVHDLTSLVDRLRALLADGLSVLVHCGAGIGRAGTVAAAVLVVGGVELDDALIAVAAQRPMAGPEAGRQRDVLEELARRHRP